MTALSRAQQPKKHRDALKRAIILLHATDLGNGRLAFEYGESSWRTVLIAPFLGEVPKSDESPASWTDWVCEAATEILAPWWTPERQKYLCEVRGLITVDLNTGEEVLEPRDLQGDS